MRKKLKHKIPRRPGGRGSSFKRWNLKELRKVVERAKKMPQGY